MCPIGQPLKSRCVAAVCLRGQYLDRVDNWDVTSPATPRFLLCAVVIGTDFGAGN
jgi:hypothetical protein